MTETPGDLLRHARKERGWSHTGLARRAGVTRAYISMLEAGRRHGSPELWRRLDRVLGTSGALARAAETGPPTDEPAAPSLALHRTWSDTTADELADALAAGAPVPISAESAPRLAHLWLITDPPQRVHVEAGRRVGTELANQMLARAGQLRRIDDYLGGREFQAMVRAELAWTASVLRDAAYDDATGRRLLRAVGELAQIAGWVLSDAGQHTEAEAAYLRGVQAAHAAGDLALAGNLLSSLAYQRTNLGDTDGGLLLAQTAATGAARPDVPATARALFGERLAWAYANTGDRDGTVRALAAVDELYEQRTEHEPEWTYWLNRDEIDVMAGRCHVVLHDPAAATGPLARATAGYDPAATRERSLYLSWLAEAHIQAGEIEQAATVATEAITLAGKTTSERSDGRAALLRRQLAPYAQLPAVRDVLAL